MMNSIHWDRNWWLTWLKGIFPEAYNSPEFDWNLRLGYEERIHSVWYKNGNYLMNFMFRVTEPPLYKIRILNTDIKIERVFDMINPKDDLQLIEATADNALLPLCMHTPWAKSLYTHYFTYDNIAFSSSSDTLPAKMDATLKVI